jgi:hypothetical protein
MPRYPNHRKLLRCKRLDREKSDGVVLVLSAVIVTPWRTVGAGDPRVSLVGGDEMNAVTSACPQLQRGRLPAGDQAGHGHVGRLARLDRAPVCLPAAVRRPNGDDHSRLDAAAALYSADLSADAWLLFAVLPGSVRALRLVSWHVCWPGHPRARTNSSGRHGPSRATQSAAATSTAIGAGERRPPCPTGQPAVRPEQRPLTNWSRHE